MTDHYIKNKQRINIISFILLVGLGLLGYLGLRSANFDPNGITEIEFFQTGVNALFTPNHILFRVVVLLVYNLFHFFGYTGTPVLPAQFTTAVFSALGLGLFYWWLRKFIHNNAITIITTLAFGGSWSYWVFSTDIYYVTPACAFILGALIVLSDLVIQPPTRPFDRRYIGLAVLCAFSILFWQANIFFLLIVGLVLLDRYKKEPGKLIVSGLFFGGVLAALIAGVYLYVGAVVFQRTSVTSFMDWILHYSARLPIWGKWEFSRIGEEAHSIISSLIPVWEGLGVSELLKGQFQIGKLISQLSLLAVILVISIPLVLHLKTRFQMLGTQHKAILAGVLVYTVYIPFNIWWDPFEPKWLVVANIGFWTIIAILWDRIAETTSQVSRKVAILGLLVLWIPLANFTTTIWPNHANINRNLQTAECVAANLQPGSLFVSTDNDYFNYLSFFYQVKVFDLTGNTAYYKGKTVALDLLTQEMAQASQAGRKTYIYNLDAYPAEHIDWMVLLTGITRAEFSQFKRIPAFSCGTLEFQELESIR
jgi:hypothetical protein